MKSCTIITCNNCEFYNTQYCKNCSKEGDDCYEHWEWRHDVSWRQEQIDNLTQKISDLEAKLAESKNKHLLDEKEWQDYCSFKHIEPEIRGCLDREREYKQQLAMQENTITNLIEDNRASQEWYKMQLVN